ncbi:acyl-CoA ligase (AMP-forming), exosortase A system-associated [Actinoplanes derwentensis]|uniref:Acyl-CoA ligase (AMP-forming), exosortase A-associated n=1 Tax=Actinoplanes derwentensis TaxID=113562 RepID=A0A1H2BBI0_9ACTN|nr:acyl-CoA ligase (AMP-forming), exosortase A system-associated [Actinoplanes derwentensis]GID88617.1 acyl-CoA ligase (AMP-forming), exosortase A system-associated [Actinoplanes derwentensis]SDT55660.1 acyl-CoA ligase (AMP-forming), exosortase A-associated [Actinoplanes derwentensis]
MRIRLHDLLAGAADSPALTYRDETVSYATLWREVRAKGAGLRRLIDKGDRVAVYLDKRIETVTAIFATSYAGGAFVPVNPVLRAKQVAYILADCDVRVLITTPDRLEALGDELEQVKSLRQVIVVGSPEWDALTGEEEPVTGVDVEVAAILYTSGSTGRPKGVVLSHRNLLAGAESVSTYLELTGDDVVLAALPLSFDAGFSQLTTSFAVRAHVVLVNYLLPRDVVKLCTRHGVTALTCVPPLWIQLAEQTWPEQTGRGLRLFANTGGRMPKTTLDRLRSLFPEARPFLMYGLTEAFRSTYLDPAQVDRRPDSIGKAIPNAEILVVRPDGSVCDPGEEGELVHRGALVALGYWNDPQRTAERFRPLPGTEGALLPEPAVWSGDSVVRDEQGFLYFVGRTDDMIKTSGYRVSPTEIEEVVYGTGLVRDAVALGLPDPKLGHRIVLIVSPAGDELDVDALKAALKKDLPLYMLPKDVQVRPELPRSPNGKFDRNLLRAEVTA